MHNVLDPFHEEETQEGGKEGDVLLATFGVIWLGPIVEGQRPWMCGYAGEMIGPIEGTMQEVHESYVS